MKYMGSKARHAKEFLPLILKKRGFLQYYVEPFMGGCNSLDKVRGRRIGSDNNPYLVALFDAVVNQGWKPPEDISESFYQKVKDNPESYDSPLVGFVAFGCSYSGKFWGGYARGNANNGSPRNYARESRANILRQAPLLKGVRFSCCSYEKLPIPKNSIIYCDIPYEGTTRYANEFDHSKFWKWADLQLKNGHNLFVSEYQAPKSWKCIWEKTVNSSLTANTGSKQGIERLFTK